MKTENSDRIRAYAFQAYIEPARKRGATTVEIVAGEVQKALHLNGRTPQVCSALKSEKFLHSNGLKLQKWEGPPSGQSTTVKFTYQLLKAAETGKEQVPPNLVDRLWGIGREVFQSLGGGEEFIRREREEFYGPEARS